MHSLQVTGMSGGKNLFIHYTLSNPQIRCVAAHILWQPSSLPCLVIFSTMSMKDLSIETYIVYQ